MYGFFPLWPGVALVGLLLAVGLLAFGARFLWRRHRTPKLVQALRPLTPWIRTNLLLPDGLGSTIHVDGLDLTGQMLHAVQMFRIEGAIFGSANMNEWTVLGRSGRWTFPNPLLTGPLRILALQEQLVTRIPIQVDYVFWGDCDFPKGKEDGVHELTEYLESMGREISLSGDPPESWQEAWRRLETPGVFGLTGSRPRTP